VCDKRGGAEGVGFAGCKGLRKCVCVVEVGVLCGGRCIRLNVRTSVLCVSDPQEVLILTATVSDVIRPFCPPCYPSARFAGETPRDKGPLFQQRADYFSMYKTVSKLPDVSSLPSAMHQR
jgi:hypothetical protein